MEQKLREGWVLQRTRVSLAYGRRVAYFVYPKDDSARMETVDSRTGDWLVESEKVRRLPFRHYAFESYEWNRASS